MIRIREKKGRVFAIKCFRFRAIFWLEKKEKIGNRPEISHLKKVLDIIFFSIIYNLCVNVNIFLVGLFYFLALSLTQKESR